ncbi:MAG TPA: helix-turn-helix domain-containing protein [Phenylobacterium sp.]
MERKSWADAACPMARTIDLLGEWGSLLILREAFEGVTRFDDFQKRLGISRSLLTTRLRTLVDGGVLERRPIVAEARRHEYVLTEMGHDLFPMVVAMRQWGDRWLFAPDTVPTDMIDTRDGASVAPLEVRSVIGRRLSLKDFGFRKRPAA